MIKNLCPVSHFRDLDFWLMKDKDFTAAKSINFWPWEINQNEKLKKAVIVCSEAALTAMDIPQGANIHCHIDMMSRPSL